MYHRQIIWGVVSSTASEALALHVKLVGSTDPWIYDLLGFGCFPLHMQADTVVRR